VLALASAAASASDNISTRSAKPKVLRVASLPETGFDPVRIGDIYSELVISHIFEALYGYDPLYRPYRIVPRLATSMPHSSSDFRSWTVRLQPGIRFADDPAFEGRPRELVADDVVYSLKRYADPQNKSPQWSKVEQAGISGLAALRRRAVEAKQPFDYDDPIDGLQVLDRYTVRFRLDAARPRFVELLANIYVVAREVVQAHGEATMEHPIGTGPFRLAQWRRSSRIVLERNPGYRDVRYHAEPAPGDAEGAALAAKFAGRRLPMIDRVEISVIEEDQPLWLAFLNREIDVIVVPNEFVELAMPNGEVAPYLARRGVRGRRQSRPTVNYTYFNMEDRTVGGYTADKVALRRAIGLALDVDREILLLSHGQGVRAQSPIAPNTSGYDPAYRSEMGEYSPARAKALLDMYGYLDRDGDGWREQPDGSPLVLDVATFTDQLSRQLNGLMQRDLEAVGLRVRFLPGTFPEQAKAARAGKLMMLSVGGAADAPDGQVHLARYYSAAVGGENLARFKRPEMDALYEQLLALPDGPERQALFDRAKGLATVWMPYKVRYHGVGSTLTQPWLVGYRRPVFWFNWFEAVDIEKGHDSR
jgi:ABC-type transport system substrate-binding protein